MNILKLFQSQFQQAGKLSKPARFLLLAILLDGLLFTAFGLFFNFYIIESGFSREYLGLINAMPSIAALVMGLPMGMLSDRIGRKRSMVIGFSLANFAIITMLVVRQPMLMLIMAFIWGATGQLYFLSQAPFMMKVSDDKSRDLLFSLSFGVFPLASTLGNVLAGVLPDFFSRIFNLQPQSAETYKVVLLASVISSFAVLIPIMFIKEPPGVEKSSETPHKHATLATVWRILKRPLTIKLSLPNLITGFGAAMIVPYFNVFLVDKFQLSDKLLGTIFAVSSLMVGLATFIGPRLVGRLGGKIRMIVLSQAVSLVFLVMLGFSPYPWLAVIGFLIRGMLMNMAAPLFDAYSMERATENEQGTINSIRNWAWNVGWAVGPYISGVIQQYYGFSPIFLLTLILYAVGILLTWIYFGRRKSPAAVGTAV
ncbi:MFS transporter [Chloroflexota bacterium]